jgi:hypothetical protein
MWSWEMKDRERTREMCAGQSHTLWLGLILLLLGVTATALAQPVHPEEGVSIPNQGTPNQGLPALAFPINDDDPASSVPTPEQSSKSPLDMGYWVMAVSDRAEAALKKNDQAKAAKYFAALAAAVPDRAISFTKLCKSLEASGDHKGALEACRNALGKGGVTIEDHVRYVELVLEGTAPLTKTQIADADAIADQLDSKLGANSVPLVANQLRCEIGLRLQDKVRLQACTGAFQRLAPKDPRTTAFEFALALQANELDKAQDLIGQAKQNKLPAAALAQMETALRIEQEKAPSIGKALGGFFGPLLAVVALVVLFTFGTRRTRKLRPT